jgi:hypothetical protein
VEAVIVTHSIALKQIKFLQERVLSVLHSISSALVGGSATYRSVELKRYTTLKGGCAIAC